eukprot:TRINITY_DN37068_c0_g1_i1.p2 TRINITY_DN37068_c0_g1~~TRINITY_DN37068_c0_g1_i1.p2  ORF type:complete len:120 (-),score=26.41 TRINITY_DN37068_c0_g1_i1:129-488(-)
MACTESLRRHQAVLVARRDRRMADLGVSTKHKGEWRARGQMLEGCSTPDRPDGQHLCTHKASEIMEEHWSCCGETLITKHTCTWFQNAKSAEDQKKDEEALIARMNAAEDDDDFVVISK